MSEDKDCLPKDRHAVLRLVPMPRDTNAAGDIFGGWLMSQVDVAGAIAATARAGSRVVTVAVREMQFHKPVYVGDIVSCYADVTHVGRTSLTVFVEVFVQRKRGMAECVKVTEATVTYVAVGENGRSHVVDRNER